jgi:hypothetical protein
LCSPLSLVISEYKSCEISPREEPDDNVIIGFICWGNKYIIFITELSFMKEMFVGEKNFYSYIVLNNFPTTICWGKNLERFVVGLFCTSHLLEKRIFLKIIMGCI